MNSFAEINFENSGEEVAIPHRLVRRKAKSNEPDRKASTEVVLVQPWEQTRSASLISFGNEKCIVNVCAPTCGRF